jgi:hypothetical protein
LGGGRDVAPDRSPERGRPLVTRTKKSAVASFAAAAISAVLSMTLLASPAQAADTGLYGAPDPSSDAVYRQSLAILGLTSVGIRPAASAIEWLVDQQCADGSFQSYRADTSVPCAPSDPVAFSGPDTNSTALAAMALESVDQDRSARRAAIALIDGAQTSGRFASWPYNFGGTPDASSTGLVVNALDAVGANSATIAAGQRWLRARIIPCGRSYGGALRNDATTSAANNFATAQGLLGLTEALPVDDRSYPRANPQCSGSPVARVSSYLARTLSRDGILTYSGFGGNDYGSTSAAVIGLGEAQLGKRGIETAVAALQRDAREWIATDAGDSVGAAGWLLMVAESTGEDPRSFGGVDLVRTITGSIR